MSGRKSWRDAGISCLHQAAAGLTLNKTKREQTETGRRNRGEVQIRRCRGEEGTESKVLKTSRLQAREQQNTVKVSAVSVASTVLGLVGLAAGTGSLGVQSGNTEVNKLTASS